MWPHVLGERCRFASASEGVARRPRARRESIPSVTIKARESMDWRDVRFSSVGRGRGGRGDSRRLTKLAADPS
jgi:hypothetical protein